MKYFKKLVGEKVYLSPRNMEDIELYVQWLNDFHTTDYIGRSHQTISIEEEREYLENPMKDEISFAIVDLTKDLLIGTLSLCHINYIKRTATLGIFIGNPEYRSKGYGTEAIKLLLEYAFHYLNLNNIKLDVLEINQRAISCYKKCGFKEYGRRRKCNFINGKYYDTIEMGILAEEFEGDYIKNKNI